MNDTNCIKDFIKYSSFNVLGMIGLSCYILADTESLGKSPSVISMVLKSLKTSNC